MILHFTVIVEFIAWEGKKMTWINELKKEQYGKEYCITYLIYGKIFCIRCKYKFCEKLLGE